MITLDGYTLRSFGLSCEKQIHPLTPKYSNRTLAIPGRNGLYYLGTDIKEKPHSFMIGSIAKDKTFLQHRLREFIAFLHDNYGNPRAIKLSYVYEPDKYYTVMMSGQIDVDRVLRTGKFTLTFVSYDPYAYSEVYADEVLWGSNVITFQSSYKLGRGASDGLRTITGATTLNVLVDGIAIKPVIEMSGSGTNVVISSNGYNISLGTFTGATWVIDCDKYTVLKNGINTFGAVSLRDFFLLPGSNAVSITGAGMYFTIHIKARDKYI